MNEHNVIEIKDLSVDFMTVRGIVYAVQGVDLSVKEGEILLHCGGRNVGAGG